MEKNKKKIIKLRMLPVSDIIMVLHAVCMISILYENC